MTVCGGEHAAPCADAISGMAGLITSAAALAVIGAMVLLIVFRPQIQAILDRRAGITPPAPISPQVARSLKDQRPECEARPHHTQVRSERLGTVADSVWVEGTR